MEDREATQTGFVGFREIVKAIPCSWNSTADLIVQSGVKDYLDEHNVSADFYDVLDEEVAGLLADAAERAEANDRRTVQPRDL